jgi:hypothetical protein
LRNFDAELHGRAHPAPLNQRDQRISRSCGMFSPGATISGISGYARLFAKVRALDPQKLIASGRGRVELF